MSHDFDDKHGGHDGACNNKGIMSYGSTDYTGWSECSRSDFEQHYASENWANCLEDISGEKCFPVFEFIFHFASYTIIGQFRWTCNLIIGLIRFRCAG